MPHTITPITLPLPLHMGSVNCYLIQTAAGYFLIDTGGANARRALHRELVRAGCTPGSLKLILLTHGDFDHTGNVAYLRATFGAEVAMHRSDKDMAERGDMFANRKQPNILIRTLVPLFTGFGKSKRFTPDLFLEDGTDLSPYGLEATVLNLPGHSLGSLGILTAGGAFFCGDLLENTAGPQGDVPALGSIMDDPTAARASLARLAHLQTTQVQPMTVYPGHGAPFTAEALQHIHAAAGATPT